MKICSKCKVEKPIDEFHLRSAVRDGHKPRCKECSNEDAKEYRENNAEKIKQYDKENYEKRITYQKQYKKENSEKIITYKKQYNKENPHIIAANDHRRRARKLKLDDNTVTSSFIKDLAKRDTRCPCCSKALTEANRHLAHVVPLSIGGMNSEKKLRYFCSTCNLEQNSRHPMQHWHDEPYVFCALLKIPRYRWKEMHILTTNLLKNV